MPYNTGNPVGSRSPKDLVDNSENLDRAMNSDDETWVDRLGIVRPTLKRLEAEFPSAGFDADRAVVAKELAEEAAETSQVASQAAVAAKDESISQAGAAAQSAADALDAAGTAEAAAAAALSDGVIYDDASAGLAATSEGDYFYVPASGDDSIILYQHDAGSVATERSRMPSSALVLGMNPDVVKLKNDLGSIAWLDDEAYTRTGQGATEWEWVTRPHRIEVAKAIKNVVLYGADENKKYVISHFSNDDPTNLDKIVIAEQNGVAFVSNGDSAITKNPDGITKVELSDGGLIKAALWINYNEIAPTGVLTTDPAGPFIISSGSLHINNVRIGDLEISAQAVNVPRRVLEIEIGDVPWLDKAMLNRTGAEDTDWYFPGRSYREIARAIKWIYLPGGESGKTYTISNFNVSHPTNLDRIIIAEDGVQFATNGTTSISKSSDGLTKVELNSGPSQAIMWIDYNELDGLTGGLATGTDNPLQIDPVGSAQAINSFQASDAAGVRFDNVAFIGDSITMLGDYPSRVGGIVGIDTVHSFGFGGCRMGRHDPDGRGVYKDWMCMYRLSEMILSGDFSDLIQAGDDLFTEDGQDFRPQCNAFAAADWGSMDAVVIFFGTNDWAADNVLLGADGDNDPTGASFIGAMNYVVENLLTAYPEMKIVFVGPMWRARKVDGDGLDADTNPNDAGEYLIEYTDACVGTAHENKIPAFDLYRNSGINKYNESTFFVDGLHPSHGVGYQRLAERIGGFLKNSI